MNARQQLLLHLLKGGVRQSTIPMPKTTRMREMRALKAEGLAISEDGIWRLTGDGREHVKYMFSKAPTPPEQPDYEFTDINPDTLPMPRPEWRRQPIKKQSLFKTLIGY